MDFTMNTLRIEDVIECSNGQTAQSSSDITAPNDYRMCVLEKERRGNHQHQNKFSVQKLSPPLDIVRRCSIKPGVHDAFIDESEVYKNLNCVESVQDKHLYCLETTQSKNLHPNSQSTVPEFQRLSHFSEVPESWNLFAQESVNWQQDSYISSVGMSARGSTVLNNAIGSKVSNGVAAPLERSSSFSEKVESVEANAAHLSFQERSAAGYLEISSRSNPDMLEEEVNDKQQLANHGSDQSHTSKKSDKADILWGETSENHNRTLDSVHKAKDKSNEDNEEVGETDYDKTKQASSDECEEDKCKAKHTDSVESSLVVKANKRFQCQVCNKSCRFQKGLNKHMKTHKEFVCPVSSSCFNNVVQLKRHILAHSDGKPMSSPDQSTTGQSMINNESIVRAFPCSLCFYKAKQRKDLTKHMVVHTAVKVHKCQLCKFSSKRKYSLHRHLMTVHSSARVYECTMCNFKISAFDSFKSHIAMHVSACTTSCAVCGTEIKERPNLIEHLLSHSMGLKSTCKKCEQIYFTSNEYMHHLLSHKDLSAVDHQDACKTSVFGQSISSFLKDNAASRSSSSGLMTLESRLDIKASTLDSKLSQMSAIVSRLAHVTDVVTLSSDKSRVALQLAEISGLATELALLSENMLQPYKNSCDVIADTSSAKPEDLLVSSDIMEDSSFLNEEFVLSSVLDIDADAIKEECEDKVYGSMDASMQIQVDFSGDAVSCVQKGDHFKQGRSILEHKREKHMICTLCNLVFTDTCSLKRHLMVHVDARPYSCENCGQSFRRKEHRKKHMVTHSNERPFVCPECQYGAKTEERLKIHMFCHSQIKEFACQLCSYSGRSSYELNQHMKRHKPQTCSQCNCVCYSRAELKKHIFTHSSFDCSVCGFTTNDRVKYTKHVKKHSTVQYLCCELCGYSCDTMRKFKYHKLRHENKTPFECPDCDYKCSSRASFDCHRLKHAGLKPYLCSFCGSSFVKTSHLNQHMLIHKDEKAFRCSVCGYTCRTKHNLKEHEMTHSGERPYACKYCNFSSRRKKALILHTLKHEME